MKKKVLLFVGILCCACSKAPVDEIGKSGETGSEQKDRITVNIGSDAVKTALGQENAGKVPVLWTDKDELMLVGKGNTHACYQTSTADISTEDGRIAVFTITDGTVPDKTEKSMAVYPYSSVIVATLDKAIMNVPGTQPYQKGSFAAGINPMASMNEAGSGSLTMKSVFGCIHFSIKGEGQKVSGIEIADQNAESALWGSCTINADWTSGTFSCSISNSDSGKNTLKLSFTSPVELTETATDFYFTVPAGAFAGGFKISLYDSGDNLVGSKETTSACTISAGKMKRIPEFTIKAPKIKRISIIGDSISTFAGIIPEGYAPYYPVAGHLDYVEQTYWYRLAHDFMENATIDTNIAYGGTTVTTARVHDFCFNFMEQGGVGTPDIILIYGGTNDNNVAEARGLELVPGVDAITATSAPYLNDVFRMANRAKTLEQAYALPGGTFCEAYVKLLRLCTIKYPDVKIVNIIGDWLCVGMEKSIVAISDNYSNTRYVDFRVNGKNDMVNIPKIGAGCHPNYVGMEYIARTIYSTVGEWLEAE